MPQLTYYRRNPLSLAGRPIEADLIKPARTSSPNVKNMKCRSYLQFPEFWLMTLHFPIEGIPRTGGFVGDYQLKDFGNRGT